MHKLDTISRLLVQGGDARTSLAPDTGVNRYGVSPGPRSGQVEFSSSTASHIAPQAWFAVERFRTRINADLAQGCAADLWQREERRVRKAFAQIWQLDEARLQWSLQRSGTHAHALASALAYRKFGRPFRIVMGEFSETGSQVPLALLKGSRRNGENMADIREVPVRNLDGSARSVKAVDQDFYRAIAEALAEDLPVLVVRVAESKSGSIFPSLDLLRMFAGRSPGSVAGLVDCAQLRCGAAELADYLAAGFMVAVTGSKFYGAPAFCGALLAGDQWQQAWPAASVDVDVDEGGRPNFGLLARWEAALFTMSRFQRVPGEMRERITGRFQHAVMQATAEIGAVSLLDVIRDGRREPRSLFAIRCTHPGTGRSLSHEEVDLVYRRMREREQGNGSRYVLGQPVACGGKDYLRTQYLRLSLSAHMLIDACRLPDGDSEGWLQSEVSFALHALNEEIARLP
ncbi:hypothetical protein [Herbaspirillum robiniae]|uniref:Uncharacterized protein n=1 Tax=Herbaspirillum robiniae TaxID=2014887 RepID=A0ABX2LW96_9BURK|nr:hypothetical protein [Herbaspirillum robiniae]NUU02370.1 hypothetical protein [Herbaspirillum robiniae]